MLWAVLPLAFGPALADAIAGWSGPPRATAEGLAWASWAVGLVAVTAPRPWGITALRIAATGAVAVALATFPAGELAAAGALAFALAAVSLVEFPEVAEALANGPAYGDEHRYPLRAPRVVSVVLAPLAALVTAAALVAGPLLIVSGQPVWGALTVVAGAAVVFVAVRSLHALARRWLIIVPGGIVIHDPLTLLDPVLLPKDRLRQVSVATDPTAVDPGVDLRLGQPAGTVVVDVDPPVSLPVLRRSTGETELVQASRVSASLSRPGSFLSALGRRSGAAP